MRRLLLSTLLALCLLRPAGAVAETPAAAAFARGKALFEAGDLVAAIAAFERAYQLRPHHAVLCSIARAYERLNRFATAAEHYQRCLKEGAAKTKRADKVRESLEAVEKRITWVTVDSPGAGGRVYLDGVSLGAAPRRIALDPGRHLIEVRREGARPGSIAITTIGGEERSVTLVPVELTAASAPATRSVDPVVPSTPLPPPPGKRKLHRAWFWSGVALTVAAGGAVAAMGALTSKARSDYNATPTKEGYDSFASRRLITNILVGATGALGATSFILAFFTDFSGRASGEARVVSVTVGGRF